MKKQKKILWIISFLATLLLGSYLYVIFLLPIPENAIFSSNQGTKIFDRNNVLLYEILQEDSGKKSNIKYNDLPEKVVWAFLSSEDKEFFSHSGVNIKSLGRAIFQNVQEKRIVSGGSTITQQLARNVLGTQNERTFINKVKETAYALRFEHVYNKEIIFEKYLNTIYFGNLSYGIESAARDYFGKHVKDLDLAEIALLAGLPQSPNNYNPFYNYDLAKKRQKYVLDQMLRAEYIGDDEYKEAIEEKLVFRVNKHHIKAPHFVHFVINDLEEKYGPELVYKGGLNVVTTLDYYKQLQIEDIVKIHIDDLQDKNVTNAALISLDLNNNTVLAWIGSKDYFDESIEGANDITHALRQPGSALKPFTYLLALMNGQTLATTVADIHTQFRTSEGPYTPRNYDLQYHGLVRLREALACSFNIPAVKTLDFVGVTNFMSFLKKIGISTIDQGEEHYGLSLTLGGGEVRLIDMLGAYSVIANDGVKKPINYINKVTDSERKVLFEMEESPGVQVLGEQGALYSFLIKSVLSDNNARLRGFGEDSVLRLDRPAAVKTGTTRNFRDNWTVGFTPQILTAVWVGNADASPMHSISGVDGAGPIWNASMEFLHKNLDKETFDQPDGIIKKDICTASGLLTTENCKDTMVEYFIRGTEPTEKDNIFKKIAIDSEGGKIWTEGCDPVTRIFKVYEVYPPELKEWALEQGITPPPTEDCLGQRIVEKNANQVKNDSPQALQIVNPVNKDSYRLDPTIPDVHESIPFRITYTDDVVEACYYLDNKKIDCATEIPHSIRWVPVKGEYTLYARLRLSSDKTVQTENVVFDVK